jgi:hypothetical protein
MKAAVCYEFGKPLVVEEVKIDPPQLGELKIRLAATAICHSDIHFLKGDRGGEVVLTPLRAPDANSHAERWVWTVRTECLDHILILNQKHIVSVLREFEAYYNERRPHQGIEQRTPIMPVSSSPSDGPVRCRDVLEGIIHDYYRHAA